MKQGEADKNRYYDPGLVAYQKGDYQTAETDLKRFLSSDVDNPAVLYNLGLCLLAEGKNEEARSCFQTSAHNYGSKGKIHMCGGRPCGDLSKAMLTWMDKNPTWTASQTTSVPPFPSAP